MNRFSIGRGLLSLLFVPLIASAGSYLAVDDRTMIDQADGIAVVVVLSEHSFVSTSGLILTDYLVGVEESLKGAAGAGETITVREVGGTVGDVSLSSSTAPHFAAGEKALVFLSRVAPDAWSTWSGELGKYSFVRDLDSTALVREATDEEIFGWDLSQTRQSGRVRDAEEFLRYIREVTSSEAAYPDSTEADLEGAIRADTAAMASTAAGIWNSDTGSSINISISGTASSNTYGTVNSANTVNFNVPESFSYVYVDPVDGPTTKTPLALSVVGQALLRASSAQHQSTLGESYYTSTECDIVIQAGIGSIETEVTAHEMGHCLGFRHSNTGTPSTTNALMNSMAGSGASLKTWDRDAANQVYGDGTFDTTSTSGNAFLMQFGFTPAGGGRWQSGGFGMGVYDVVSCTAPSITAQPQSVSIASGQTATLSVTATGATSYQWYQGGSPTTGSAISGATSSSYTTPALTSSQTYSVRVTNSCGSTDSSTATVTISCPKPGISVQPQSASISSGQSVTLSVVASGSPTYQWYRGSAGDTSQAISGATNSTYTTGALTSTSSFWVKLTNSCGSTNSATATLTICVIPTITTQPQSATITSGQSATLSVGASGATMYQWYRGIKGDTNNPIFGATASSYNTGSLTATSQYWVRVSSTCSSRDSDTATVTVQSTCVVPQITAHPQSGAVQSGQTATLVVSATGTSLLYQWYEGPKDDLGHPISGATGSIYTTPALSSTTQYWVRVSNSCGEARSNTVTVTVQPACTAPSIFTQPQSATLARNGSALLGVAVAGTTPFTFQWYKGSSGDSSQPISGATGASYNTGPLTKTSSYWVRVTNSCDSANSQTATLTVPGGRRRTVRR